MEQKEKVRGPHATVDEAQALSCAGNFKQALACLARSGDEGNLSKIILAELLQHTGKANEAREIVSRLLERDRLELAIRCRCHAMLGNDSRERGCVPEAVSQFQRAAVLAEEAGDLEEKCWALLRLILTLAENADPRSAVALVGTARKEVVRLGSVWVTAGLHLSIAQLESKRGWLDDANRHIRIARILLREHANPWLEGLAAIDAACVAYLASDLDSATFEATSALRFTEISGHAATRRAALANLGHLDLARGRLDAAEVFLLNALGMAPPGSHSELGILDGLAQVKLAKGEHDECKNLLTRVFSNTAQEKEESYYELWSKITLIRLLLLQSNWRKAKSIIGSVTECLSDDADPAITTILRLLKAETLLMTGGEEEAANLIAQAASSAEGVSIEVLAEIARVAGKALAQSGDTPAAAAQFERAIAILGSVGNLQARDEALRTRLESLGEATGAVPGAEPLAPPSAAIAIGQAAALIDLAAYPEILGHEALLLLQTTGAASEVVLAAGAALAPRRILEHAGCDARRAHALAASAAATIRLPLGTWHDQPYELIATPGKSIGSRLAAQGIARLVGTALHLERARREERERTALWPVEPAEDLNGAVFASRPMIELAATARKVAPTNAMILLTGETGTGKEVLAQVIHRASPRADKPFVPFNCTAGPRELVDSQLFGYRRGAFTDAHADFPGVIRAATGGTLFLDEIGDLGLDVQPKLLRFLESGEILPLGESRPTTVNVRVIASTNAHLEALVKEGRFREDLYYRLNVIKLEVPPLRERREEIPPLVEHYLKRYGAEYQNEQLRIGEETMEYLLLYRWPGNVRELANEMRRLAALAERSAILMPEHLNPSIVAARRTIPAARREPGPTEVVVRTDQPLSAAIEHLERAMIQQALAASGGRVGPASRALGLSRKGLYLKRQRLGLADSAAG